MRSLRFSKCLKRIFELTFTTQKAKACSPWIACSVFNWKYFFGGMGGKFGPRTQSY